MNSNRSSYPIPVSLPDAVGFLRPPHQAIRGDVRLCSVLERIAGGDLAVRNTLHGLPWFTPIVGSGCLQLGDGPAINLEGLRQVANAEMQRLLGCSVLGSGEPFDVLAVNFAEALHRSRTHGDVTLDGGGVTPSRAAARLTVLTALLTRIYHLVAKYDPTPMSKYWVAERISLGGSATDDEEVSQHLRPTVERLLASMIKIGPASFQAPPTVLLERVMKDLTERPGTLSVSDLRLLTELTWIQLIHGTSIYPGWSDLLLGLLVELSSGLGVFEGYRPQIVSLHELDVSVARLLTEPTWRSWSTPSPSPSLGRDRFYAGVARLLWAEADIHALLHPEESADSVDDDEYAEVMGKRKEAVVAVNEIVLDTNRKRLIAGLPRVPPALRIPHAAAFVTSFDLEAEMALWATGRPFRIVLPVLARSGRRVDAELVWLTTVIDPAKDTSADCYPIDEDAPWDRGAEDQYARDVPDRDALWRELVALRAATRTWNVAQNALGGGAEAGGWCPIIVRVTGSPLMALPPIPRYESEDLAEAQLSDNDAVRISTVPQPKTLRIEMLEALGYSREENLEMTHALTIDEYTSVRQSEHELYFAARHESPSRALPSPLSLGTDDMERIWMGFGVQVDDPAIRLRMFTQLSAASMVQRQSRHAHPGTESSTGENGIAPAPAALRVRGLAVNQRLDENQSTSLRWLGFQFAVDGSVADLIADIEHCAKHYEHIAETLRDVAVNGRPKDHGHIVDVEWGRPRNDSCSTWRREQRSKRR
jgi:hypothetical protein